VDLRRLKDAAIEFEQNHQVGRFCDLDVYTKEGTPISSGKKKHCFLCDKPAWVCMKEGEHAFEEIRAFIENSLKNYVENKEIKKIAENLACYAVNSLLKEVAADPKPGLVTRVRNGTHKDMNVFTFINSATVLNAGYYEMALSALRENWRDDFYLNRIRSIGLKMEMEMFQATEGVNTHKGAIFLLGISVFCTALSFKQTGRVDFAYIQNMIAKITKGVSLELDLKQLKTHGQKVYTQYGFKGARGEVEAGLPIVFKHALPFASVLSETDLSIDDYLSAILVKIISKNDDTNVLYRGDLEKLEYVQKSATKIVNIGCWNNKSKKMYSELCDYSNKNNISCGGSADLLAVSLFFLEVEKAAN
jgi:holo-ACP synthase / triphosphoribosyl-dephospho-CoA synthase